MSPQMPFHTLIPRRATDEFRSIIKVLGFISLRSTKILMLHKAMLSISRSKGRVWTIEEQ